MHTTRAFSLIELTVAIAALSTLILIAVPSLVRVRARLDVSAARSAFASSHALTRQIAGQYGRLGKLHLDTIDHRFWVTVDTGEVLGSGSEDTIGPIVSVGDRFSGVRMSSNRRMLCFNARGLGTAQGECNLPNATVVFNKSAFGDTVTISRLGRLLKR